MNIDASVLAITLNLNLKPYRHYHHHTFLICCRLRAFGALETILKKQFSGLNFPLESKSEFCLFLYQMTHDSERK